MLGPCYLLPLLVLPSAYTFSPVLPFSQKVDRTFQYDGQISAKKKLYMANNLLNSLSSVFAPRSLSQIVTGANPTESIRNPAIDFFQALNQGNVESALALVSEGIVWDDTAFYKPCNGKEEFERRLRLQSDCSSFQEQSFVIDGTTVDKSRDTVGILYHKEDSSGSPIDLSRGCAVFQLDSATNLISRACLVGEPDTKGGEDGLKLLSDASKFMSKTGYNPESQTSGFAKIGNLQNGSKLSPPEKYFAAWNSRDLDAAVQVFADDVTYEDTAFPDPFTGKYNLLTHLKKCENAFPETFTFEVDNLAVDKKTVVVEWHVENDGEALPFTQGCSFYNLDNAGKILKGIDFVEPAVVKQGDVSLFLNSLQTKLSQEPARWIPLLSWVAYMYIVFFSDGILPGSNALQLEQRTWEEVLNLSLNFFLVSPLLNLPFSPSVHPMLEGVFNLLLSWAAMFAGFLSDDRRRKPNLLPMFPIVIGMQFLTSAFLLPYLATRTSEPENQPVVTKADLPAPARIAGESPVLGALMAFVGTGSIAWFFLGRAQEYGSDFAVRYASFVDLLSIDRVGSSFLVDLALFALFQGWLVEDDLKRRGLEDGGSVAAVGKYVPFFGMAAYLILRPTLPEGEEF